MTIGITGATGHLGRLVVKKLAGQVAPADLVALVRSPAKAADLGIQSRAADYDTPDTLGPALAGIETLLFISGSTTGQRIRQHGHLIDAAKQAGVQRIVYTSLLRADTSTLRPMAAEHAATERMIQASGIPATILRNGWYAENYTGSLAGALAHGAILGSAGDGRLSLAARADYADAAVAALIAPGPLAPIYELAGDVGYTLADLAAELSRQAGKSIVYRDLPEADYAAALTGFGLPADLAAAIASWDVSASQGALFDDGHQLSALIGHRTTPLSAVVADALGRLSSVA